MSAFSSARLPLVATVALAFALLASACFRIDVKVTVNDDGSGTLSVLSAINIDALKSFGESLGGDTSTPKAEDVDQSRLPPGSKVENYKDGSYEGVRVTVPFKEGDDLGKLLRDATPGKEASDGASSGATTFDSVVLQREGDGWRFEATLKSSATGDSSGQQPLSPEALKQLFKDASFTVRLQLPGSIKSHNADRVAGNELTWNIDFFATAPRTLSARSGPGGDGGLSVWLIAAGGVALLAIVGAVGALFYRRRHGSRTAPPAEAEPLP